MTPFKTYENYVDLIRARERAVVDAAMELWVAEIRPVRNHLNPDIQPARIRLQSACSALESARQR